MISFERLAGEIYRLKVPFENIYTGVFLLRTESGDILFDCATTRADAEEIIIPALDGMGSEPKYVVCSHFHGDHMGGLPYILDRFKDAKAVFRHTGTAEKHPEYNAHIPCDGEMLLGCVRVMSLPGHSDDSIGLLDTRSSVLLSADCVQLCGVGRFGTGISDGKAYLESLERIIGSDIENMITSHEYYPLGSLALGRAALEKYVEESKNVVCEIKKFALAFGAGDDSETARLYNERYSDRPPIPAGTVRAILKQ